MLDSPKTPATPNIEADITLHGSQLAESELGDIPNVDLDSYLKEKGPRDYKGVRVAIPRSIEQARQFLSSQSLRLPPQFPRKKLVFSSAESSPSASGRMICHGCHMQMGSGAHNGSAPGKGVCTFPHSLTCPGGIIEDESWAACPQGYIQGLISETGFEQTLTQSDFGPQHSSTGIVLPGAVQPGSSTPSVSGITPGTPAIVINSGALSQSVPRQTVVQFSNTPLFAPAPVYNSAPRQQSLDPTALPHHIPLVTDGNGGNLGQQEAGTPHAGWQGRLRTRTGINYDENEAVDLTISAGSVVDRAADLRARNQVANRVSDTTREFPFTINDLRADPIMRKHVEEEISVIRQDIPALSASQSAQPTLENNHLQQAAQAVPPQKVLGVVPLEAQSHNPQLQPLYQQAAPNQQPSTQPPIQIQTLHQPPTQHPAQYQVTHHLSAPQSQPVSYPLRGGAPQNTQQCVPHQRTPYQHVQSLPAQHSVLPQPIQQPYLTQQPLGQPPLYQGLTQGHLQQGYGHQQTLDHQYTVNPSQANLVQLQPGQGSAQPFLYSQPLQGPLPGRQHHDIQQALYVGTGHQHSQYTGAGHQHSNQQGTQAGCQEVFEYMTDQFGKKFLVKSAAVMRDTLPHGPATSVVGPSHYSHSHLVEAPAVTQGYQGHHVQHNQNSLPPQDRSRGSTTFLDVSRATKKLSFVDCLKRCPVKWAKDTNVRNMNLSAYGYAALAELESNMMNTSDPIPQADLLAKIRHTKNVFEVCCLNSKDSDFKGYGWVLARDYAAKVTNKVEQGYTTWDAMPPGVQTAELVSAQCDYPRLARNYDTKEVLDRDQDTRKKKICTTYNTCSVEYKCDYEVANPDKECQRIHECSWCRKHLKKGFKHQESRCKKKEE